MSRHVLALLTAWLGADATSITREGARDAARRELSKPIYHRDDEPLTVRLLRAGWEWVSRLFDTLASHAPGGAAGLVALAVLVAAAVVAIRLRLGPLQRTTTRDRAVLGATARTARDHREAADRLAAEGRWAEAVRERLRAVVRELEGRGVLDPRPGRTADEVARDAGAALPQLAPELAAGARLFDEVWYGGHPATASSYEALRRLDERVRATRQPVGAP